MDIYCHEDIYNSKVGSVSVIGWFPGSGSEILDFPLEDPDPLLINSDSEH